MKTLSRVKTLCLTSGTNAWVRLQALGPNNLTSAWTSPQGKIVP